MALLDFKTIVPTPKRVEYKDNHFFVRPILAKDIIELQKLAEVTPMEYGLKLIATCVCDEIGNALITAEECLNLPPNIMQDITNLITDTLGLGEQKN